MANILRDRRGIGNADIGEGNEKAVNQLIAHHSVIFQPDSLRIWVSTAPWQLGTYVCYDLRKVFGKKPLKDTAIAINKLNIPADSFINTRHYHDFLVFRANKMALLQSKPVDTAAVVHSNPQYYDAYRIAGDYCMNKEWYTAAINYYNKALTLEIATKGERKAILEKIKEAAKLKAALQQ